MDPRLRQRGQVRDSAWVAGLTGLLNLSSWPKSMRVIARKERPDPGAQLRFTDVDGYRITCLAISAKTGLEARCPSQRGLDPGRRLRRTGARNRSPDATADSDHIRRTGFMIKSRGR